MIAYELKKILCVDDEEDIRTIIQFSLERKAKFILEFCENGKEALEKIFAFQPDLILLDVMMPIMDGVATLRELQKKNIKTPVIFMTAKAQQDEIQKYKQLGAIEVIVKPFDALNLSTLLIEIWNGYLSKKTEKV